MAQRNSDASLHFPYFGIALKTFLLFLAFTATHEFLRAEFPDRPIKIIVPTNTGGEVDTLARMFQRSFQKHDILPVKAVVVNIAGAGGTIGTRKIKESPPDGYTIGIWTPGIVTSKAMGIARYDHNDFILIGRTGYSQLGLGVLDSSGFDSIEALIAASKSKPRSVKVATNIGLPVHLTPLMFAEAAGIEFNFIQTGGGSKRLASILGEHTDMSLFSLLEFNKFESTGLKPLVFLSDERNPHFPDTPTAQEIGVDLVVSDSRIWLAPKDTPADRIEYITKALQAVMDLPEIKKEFESLGIHNEFGGPEVVHSFLEDMRVRVTPIISKARNP